MMAVSLLPFSITGLRIGSVKNMTSHGGFSRGKLLLDSGNDKSVIHVAVLLAQLVDQACRNFAEVESHIWTTT